jgi:hypothetical protein
MFPKEGEAMSWIEKLPPEDKAALWRWRWAFNRSNPNSLPLWSIFAPLLFCPLIVDLFLRMNDQEQASSLTKLLLDWGLYTVISLAAGFVVLPLTPLIRRYVYGSTQGSMMPRIGIWHECFVKFLYMAFAHVLGSGITAVLFMKWSGRGWPSEAAIFWRWIWTMSLVSLPALIPGALVLVAKIKLVSMTRARKRREQAAAHGPILSELS